VDPLKTEDTDVGGWTAEQHVTALYQAHALSLARLALVMLGDRPAAEDVVQDAFLGLYRRWDRLADPAVAQSYLRTSVLNGCRTALRSRPRHGVLSDGTDAHEAALAGSSLSLSLESAEATVVHGEEHRAVLAAIRRLPRAVGAGADLDRRGSGDSVPGPGHHPAAAFEPVRGPPDSAEPEPEVEGHQLDDRQPGHLVADPSQFQRRLPLRRRVRGGQR